MLVSSEILLLLISIFFQGLESFADDGPMRRLISRPPQAPIRDRIKERRNPVRFSRKEICYDLLGCFENPRRGSSLKKPPQSPSEVDTKFWMYTRELNDEEPKLLRYDRQESFLRAKFDIRKPVKFIIHGFKGSGREKGTLIGARALLDMENCTVILVDWERGAGDVSYSMAVANTELVGRQTALLILDMLILGVHIANVHIIGFSLGAHVAGCAGHALKEKGYTLGRITGLDPASPIFRSSLSEARKLDRDDAAFVDIIHTDGSPVWTEGFGLLKPLGHADFFPNGGREQPGCSDGRGSVLVSYLEGSTNTSVVCSHIRAWRLFVESLKPLTTNNSCRFRSYPCYGGLDAFNQGFCFGQEESQCIQGLSNTCAIMGYPSEKSTARGAFYLVTRDTYPYCGEQLRATVLVSEKTKRTRGLLQLRLIHGKSQTPFSFQCDFLDIVRGGRLMRALAAAEFGTIGPKFTPEIKASLSYRSLAFQDPIPGDELQRPLYIDRLIVQDLDGNRWYFCGKDTLLEQNKNGTTFDEVTLTLRTTPCSV